MIAARANELIRGGLAEVQRIPFARARAAASSYDFLGTYVDDLPHVVDLAAIKRGRRADRRRPAGRRVGRLLGRDRRAARPRPDGGEPAGRPDLAVHDARLGRQDPDGLLVAARDGVADRAEGPTYDIATGNDADSDRHGIVTPDAGLMNPNHFLAVAIGYLFGGARPGWPDAARIGKTLVSSSMIDRVAASIGREMVEVPVGFKWFVPGLIDGSFGFGGEESAGASFLRTDGSAWTTDKDGIILALLASEILATTGEVAERALRRPGRPQHGEPAYARIDAAATREQKAALARAVAGRRDRDDRWPARRSPPSSPRRPATARRSAGSR